MSLGVARSPYLLWSGRLVMLKLMLRSVGLSVSGNSGDERNRDIWLWICDKGTITC